MSPSMSKMTTYNREKDGITSPHLIRQPCTTDGSSGELRSPEEFAATHCAVEDPPPSAGTAAPGAVNGAARPAGGVAQPGRRSVRPPTFVGTAASTPPAAAFQASSSDNVGLHRSDPDSVPFHSCSLIAGDDPYVVWSAGEGSGGESLASQIKQFPAESTSVCAREVVDEMSQQIAVA